MYSYTILLSVVGLLSAGSGTEPEDPSLLALPAGSITFVSQSGNYFLGAASRELLAKSSSARDGILVFDIQDVVGRALAARVDIFDETGKRVSRHEVPTGVDEVAYPAGDWMVHVHVYDKQVPILAYAEKISVRADEATRVSPRILEGSGGNLSIRKFDRDLDMVIDRVELQLNTDPDDAASVPGLDRYTWESRVLSDKARWYRGDLHAHSKYGIGSESVKELVRRADRSGLDFLAITDRNSLKAALDPDFRSKSVVLIPAMEWGNDEMGVGLAFAPKTFPYTAATPAESQAVMIRLQSQGGIFVIAHPCFGTAPWQWGLSYVNSVEAWCRSWRAIPPLWMDRLDAPMLERKDGKLIHSVALATATPGYSANGQASIFYDIELNRGLKASVVAGSYSLGKKTPLGEPITYVFAKEKSLDAILDGLRWGRTYVSHSKKGPKISFFADVQIDGTINARIGGYVPLHVPTRFYVKVEDAAGKVLQVLANGYPFRSARIDSDGTYQFDFIPQAYSAYRVRILDGPKQGEKGFDVNEMLAMSSPIYAIPVIPTTNVVKDNVWLEIESEYIRPGANTNFLPGNPDMKSIPALVPQWTL